MTDTKPKRRMCKLGKFAISSFFSPILIVYVGCNSKPDNFLAITAMVYGCLWALAGFFAIIASLVKLDEDKFWIEEPGYWDLYHDNTKLKKEVTKLKAENAHLVEATLKA